MNAGGPRQRIGAVAPVYLGNAGFVRQGGQAESVAMDGDDCVDAVRNTCEIQLHPAAVLASERIAAGHIVYEFDFRLRLRVDGEWNNAGR